MENINIQICVLVMLLTTGLVSASPVPSSSSSSPSPSATAAAAGRSRQRRQSGGQAGALRDLSTQIHQISEGAYETYCGQIENHLTFIPDVRDAETPTARCRVFSSIVGPSFSIPTHSVVDPTAPVTVETLKIHQADSMQLLHSLTSTVSAVIGAMSGRSGCTSALSGDPCSMSCSPERSPEQQLTCTIHSAVIPRLNNYNDLLQVEIGSAWTGTPIDVVITSATDFTSLRYHYVSMMTYAYDQATANKDVQSRFN